MEVSYLGHVIYREEVSTDPAKIDKVAKWPTPQSTKDVEQFLGLAGYYRRFVHDFVAIAKPLHHLTVRTVNGHQSAKRHLKCCISGYAQHPSWLSQTLAIHSS